MRITRSRSSSSAASQQPSLTRHVVTTKRSSLSLSSTATKSGAARKVAIVEVPTRVPRTALKMEEEMLKKDDEDDMQQHGAVRRKRTELRRKSNNTIASDTNDVIKSELVVLTQQTADEPSKPKRVKQGSETFTSTSTVIASSILTPSKPKYNLTPGISPFPTFPHPTPDECHTVASLLTTMHGQPVRTHLEPPSLTMSGCGEVPSILDALIRTLLSAATSLANSSRAFQGLIARYGVLEDGVGKGSVDWNKVRLGTTDELRDVIRCGGLADVKSRNIKRILELVWEENEEMRREAGPADSCIKQEPVSSSSANATPPLSLDHLHHLPTAVAMQRLMSLPGIGVKTASCVSMFCMQRDSFPVDTHVWRLCKWLGWTPEAATRDQTFMHTDAMIPNDLKYPLHVLFWQHGSRCPKCRLVPVKGKTDFDHLPCPIEHLVKRDGGKRGGKATAKAKKGKGGSTEGSKQRKRKRAGDVESEAESSREE